MADPLIALFVLLCSITDIHVAVGTCMACAISGTVTSRRFHDRVKSQHPPGIPRLARKQHHEMDTESQYHRTYIGAMARSISS